MVFCGLTGLEACCFLRGLLLFGACWFGGLLLFDGLIGFWGLLFFEGFIGGIHRWSRVVVGCFGESCQNSAFEEIGG